jgi:pimeloyl-ACP methyl ester carboxylesterase
MGGLGLTLTILAAALLLIVIAPAAGAIAQGIALARDARRFPPPGRLVDIGGSRLHIDLMGDGAPLVVFDAGIAATSLSWRLVQPEVAKFTRTASYDRAGLGWSDPASGPRTAERAAGELHELLHRAALAGPVILVGHSYGGLIARAFATRHRAEVAGMVLVDPPAAAEWAEPSPSHDQMRSRAIRLARRGAFLARLGVVRFALSLVSAGARRAPKLIARAASRRGGAAFTERMAAEIRKLPRETWPMVQAHWCDAKCFDAMAGYLEGLPKTCAEALRKSGAGSLGDLPIVIFSADNASDAQRAEHRTLVQLSSRTRCEAVAGGHWIQLDHPELLIAAIREMVEGASPV